jgi:hypothetical protein
MMLGHFLYHIFGLSGTGPLNAFYQGIGGDLSELSIVAAMAILIRKHQCHQKRCLRFGHYKQDDIGTIKCRKHLGLKRQSTMSTARLSLWVALGIFTLAAICCVAFLVL